MSQIDLLPCPFCGSKDVALGVQEADHCVDCMGCGMCFTVFEHFTWESDAKKTIEAWNRREGHDSQED